jgi:hypothetical protein
MRNWQKQWFEPTTAATNPVAHLLAKLFVQLSKRVY